MIRGFRICIRDSSYADLTSERQQQMKQERTQQQHREQQHGSSRIRSSGQGIIQVKASEVLDPLQTNLIPKGRDSNCAALHHGLRTLSMDCEAGSKTKLPDSAAPEFRVSASLLQKFKPLNPNALKSAWRAWGLS